jgi:RNA polymerase sigma-70 factor, ECF subfamily
LNRIGDAVEISDENTTVLMRAVGGDADALHEVLAAYHPRLLAYVTKHLPAEVRSFVDPQDTVQDTCFEACRLIANFKPSGRDSTFRWLVTIARHRMVDVSRVHRTRSSDGSGDRGQDNSLTMLLSELAVYRRTPSRSAASHEFLAAVEQAMHRLPPLYREVLSLRHVDGLSAQETAAKMDRTPEAVYWLCCRALDAIRLDLRSASLFI